MTTETLSQDEQDFDKFFDETASKKRPAGDKPAATQQEGATETTDEPSQEGAGNEGGEGGQGSESGGDGGGADDVASLKQRLDTVTRERDEALHKWRSDANRQSNLMRENNRLTGEVETLKAKVAELEQKLTAKPKAPEADPNDALEGAPELKAAVEGRIQRAIEEATRDLQAKLDAATEKLAEVGQTAEQAASRLEPLASREEQNRLERIRAELDSMFPGWRARQGELAEWVKTQPAQVQAMFPGSGLDDSKALLKLFYADKGAKQPGKTGTGAESEDRLAKAAGIAPRTVTKPQVSNDDFDGAFAEFSASKKR